MLVGFKLRNFRSFLSEQSFTFASSPDRTHEATHCIRTGMKAIPRVSKAAIVFGPNASGKTNLLMAVATLRDLMLHSTSFSDAQLRERYTPFLFGPSVEQPTELEIDLLLGDVRITADETNNALLIVTTGEKYRLVEQALQQLDAVPLQVMLEACVAEVHLTNQLQYGLQYYFRNGNFSLLRSAVVPASLAADTGGLSLVFSQGNSIQAVLDLIASLTKVTVISAPRVMVVNNRTASIEVGDQVPIATSTAVGVITANAPVVNTIQLLDTGIILRVTPRVGAGGLVLLDINQEVSSVVPTTSSSINSPTIQQRKITSSIAVQDGQTLAIGGLISDTRTKTRSGIPYLMDLPYVGPLFSLRNDQVDRTELIVLITPRVVQDEQEADAVTEELRQKLPMIRDLSGRR